MPGLSLRNLLFISSSSLTNSAEKEQEVGTGRRRAIVLNSVFEEQIAMIAHHMVNPWFSQGDDYLSTYVRSHAPGTNISLIEQTKKSLHHSLSLPASTASATQNGRDFARTVNAGADALEINIPFLCRPKKDYQCGFSEQRHIDIVSSIKKQTHPRHCETGSNLTNPASH